MVYGLCKGDKHSAYGPSEYDFHLPFTFLSAKLVNLRFGLTENGPQLKLWSQQKTKQISEMTRNQPNSREKMRDFTVEFLKYAKFTEGVLRNSRALQPLIRGAMLMQTKKSVK